MKWHEQLSRYGNLFSSDSISGTSPPSVFVGSYNYPQVFVGPMVPPIHGDTAILDSPENWHGKSLEEIVNFRLNLVRGTQKISVDTTEGRYIENLQEITMSEKPTESDLVFQKTTSSKISLDGESAESLEKRVKIIKSLEKPTKPRVLAIEWIDPFFTAEHWVPEMIEFAGGENMISKSGEHSRRLKFEEISSIDPELIILMPCGFGVKRTLLEYESTLKNNKEWSKLKAVKNNRVFAVDANSYFSKPSIRTIIGLEILAKIIQPEKFRKISIPEESFLRI